MLLLRQLNQPVESVPSGEALSASSCIETDVLVHHDPSVLFCGITALANLVVN
jgi:hypothetical protein